MVEDSAPVRAPRGRPRSERARVAILQATTDLLVTGGLEATTVEAIAARAGVSKMTIYKWWPNRGQVMLESLFSRTSHTTTVTAGRSLAENLVEQIRSLVSAFRDTEVGPLFARIVAAAQSDTEIRAALHQQWLEPRRAVGAGLLRDAVERGELDRRTDVAVAVDQLFAPVYHRLLMGHEPLDDGLAAKVVAQLLDGLRLRS